MKRPADQESGPAGFSIGVWAIIGIAGLSTALLFAFPVTRPEGLAFWVFARQHMEAYRPVADRWNTGEPGRQVRLLQIDLTALERRLMSAFLSGTPGPDLVEVERGILGQALRGTVGEVGFIDLASRLREENLLGRINPPSLGLWSRGGRIYGIPHDVHPVLLAYRADIVEGAGIDVGGIETWDDFSRILAPLMDQRDPQGRPTRFLLNFWQTNSGLIEVLLLQAGGGLFAADGRPVIDQPPNPRVLARMVTWVVGPGRIAVDAPEFNAGGNRLKLDGTAICSLMPDWLAATWKSDLPGLAGKLKLMPLPAWEKGGRRTSVMGGTMLGIPKAGRDHDAAWAFARKLYFDPELAQEVFRKTNIIPAIRDFWELPAFREPDPYFCGQLAGQLFIAQAPDVPRRTSSPFYSLAMSRVSDALDRTCTTAVARGNYEPAFLEAEATKNLHRVQEEVELLMSRDVFSGMEANP